MRNRAKHISSTKDTASDCCVIKINTSRVEICRVLFNTWWDSHVFQVPNNYPGLGEGHALLFFLLETQNLYFLNFMEIFEHEVSHSNVNN